MNTICEDPNCEACAAADRIGGEEIAAYGQLPILQTKTPVLIDAYLPPEMT